MALENACKLEMEERLYPAGEEKAGLNFLC